MRKRIPSRPQRVPKPWLAGAALLDSAPFCEGDATRTVNVVRTALQRLVDGTAEDKHFITIGCAINVASVRAEEISEELVQILDAAGRELTDSQDRRQERGKFGLTGPGIAVVHEGIDAYEALLRASSPRQMQAAEQEVVRRLNVRPGATT